MSDTPNPYLPPTDTTVDSLVERAKANYVKGIFERPFWYIYAMLYPVSAIGFGASVLLALMPVDAFGFPDSAWAIIGGLAIAVVVGLIGLFAPNVIVRRRSERPDVFLPQIKADLASDREKAMQQAAKDEETANALFMTGCNTLPTDLDSKVVSLFIRDTRYEITRVWDLYVSKWTSEVQKNQ